MSRSVKKILVTRLLISMAKAVATQNIQVTAYGLENQTSVLGSEQFTGSLKIIPRSFRYKKTILDGIQDTIALAKVIMHERPDIVHVNALQDLLSVFLAVRLSMKRKNRPAIVAMTHSPLTWNNPRNAWFATQAIRLFTDGFVCLATTHKRQLLRSGIPEAMIKVIPNPYDAEQKSQIKTSNDGGGTRTFKAARILYIASICERKAQDILLQAASLVLKKHPGVRFDLVGGVIPGEEKYAERVYSLNKELHTQEQVHFLGAIPYHDTMDLLAASDIFVFPTRSEMMPRAVIEAMLVGKPIVASAVDGILDLLENGKSGILVQPGNADELAKAICGFIKDPSFAKQLGKKAQEYVSVFCSPENVGKSFLDFYQSIIEPT